MEDLDNKNKNNKASDNNWMHKIYISNIFHWILQPISSQQQWITIESVLVELLRYAIVIVVYWWMLVMISLVIAILPLLDVNYYNIIVIKSFIQSYVQTV